MNHLLLHDTAPTELYTLSLHDALPIFAAAVTEVKQSETSEKSLLRRAMESCQVTDSPTRLVEALKMAESLTRDKTGAEVHLDRKSTRLNSSHVAISYDVFCLKKKNTTK